MNFPEKYSLIAGSVEMEKLRQAVMGQNGQNLDDLDHMDGIVS